MKRQVCKVKIRPLSSPQFYFFLANRYTETLASGLGQGVLDVRSKRE